MGFKISGRGYSGFQETGVIEGHIFWFEIFNSGFFGIGKFGKYFFVGHDLSRDRDFWGYLVVYIFNGLHCICFILFF